MKFVIRCGTPDCEWRNKMPDMSEEQLDLCYSEFRKHCIKFHGLEEWETDAYTQLNLEHWTLMLLRT